ncbi:hypothetical protein [Aestuariivita sp.]|uniref:hypothetical protein n=1 Tax=Aestuariivita sp. TaxID=1872407 RepID=UPI002172E102|nr:hypothetical protein [Aestuariivita sp.]MCE8005808.1 hypothetical protein [Aestuariivita sp.]
MTSSNPIEMPEHVRSLIPLGDYKWPRSEAEQTIGHLLEKFKMGFGTAKNAAAIDTGELKKRSDEMLERALRTVLETVLLDALSATYLGWATKGTNSRTKRLLVHPPMGTDILSDWAKRHDFPVLSELKQLREKFDVACFVVPSIEVFFGRHVDQLTPLFDFFEALSAYQGRVLVGCSSWARRFLWQFDELQFMLGEGETFPAFDADALASVFERALESNAVVKSVATGAPILKRDDDGNLVDPFLKKLAEVSLGHPWVAVEMFLQGIAEAADADEKTSESQLWVQFPAACSLPTPANDAHLFALQSLLIHGPRKIEEFDKLLPSPTVKGVWSALQQNGFVDIHDGSVSCAIRNYPEIRSELGAAGFNLDRL